MNREDRWGSEGGRRGSGGVGGESSRGGEGRTLRRPSSHTTERVLIIVNGWSYTRMASCSLVVRERVGAGLWRHVPCRQADASRLEKVELV